MGLPGLVARHADVGQQTSVEPAQSRKLAQAGMRRDGETAPRLTQEISEGNRPGHRVQVRRVDDRLSCCQPLLHKGSLGLQCRA